MAVEDGEGREIVDIVTPKEDVLAGDVVVDAADPLVVGVIGEIAEESLPARVGRNRDVLGC